MRSMRRSSQATTSLCGFACRSFSLWMVTHASNSPSARASSTRTWRRAIGSEGSSGGEEDADGYYSLVQKKSKEKKEHKKAEYEAARAAEREELVSVDTPDGPRGLTNAILKNRGLTPHRSKSVRNPRVKKRQKFEKAKKKLSSQKAVYKGGIGESGRYNGEKTGISKVVKAVRL